MKINNVSLTKNCNVCRCLMLGSEGIERCQRCIEVHGMTGIPIILTQKGAEPIQALKQLESIEFQRKRELLINPETRKTYDIYLTRCIHNIYGYDKSSIDKMTFEAREELAKIIYEAIQKSRISVGLTIVIGFIIQFMISAVAFKLGLTNFPGVFIEIIVSSTLFFFLYFGLYINNIRKRDKLDVACMYAIGFEKEYEKFH